MANRYAKTRSTSLTTRETQTKPRRDISSHLLGWLLLNRQVMAVGEDVEQREPLYAAGGNVDWCSHYGKQCAGSSRTRKAEPSCDPATPLQGVDSREKTSGSQRDMGTPRLTVAQFPTAKGQKQPKRPPRRSGSRKLAYTHNGI